MMASIDFTRDELEIIYARMQVECDDWVDYWSPEALERIKSIMAKIEQKIKNFDYEGA